MVAPNDTLGLDPLFERTAVALACSRPTFWATVGHALAPENVNQAQCVLLLSAARAIAADTGRAPHSATIVMQRLRRWLGEGKHKQESIEAAMDVLSEFDLARVDETAVATELIPLLRRRIQQDAVRAAIDEFGRSQDFERATKLFDAARSLGTHDGSIGSLFGMDSFANIARMRGGDRLPTGVFELDIGIHGGMPRGRLGVIMAGTNVGKTCWLVCQSTLALRRGGLVAYATLECPVPEIEARAIACLTGAPISSLLEADGAKARELLEPMLPTLGKLYAKSFVALATTVRDVAEWVKQVEAAVGREIDLLVVDYGDYLSDGGKWKDRFTMTMREVFEQLRIYAESRSIWVWTATAAKRIERQARGKRLEVDDVGEALNKVKIADLVISANLEREGSDQISFYVAKNRVGRSRFGVGPLPTDFDVGRIVANYGVPNNGGSP